jgi:hypothetical protein
MMVKDNYYHGKGIEIRMYPGGFKYEGQFNNGFKNGQGIWYFPNGNKYDGDWKKNQFHLKGTMYLANGVTINFDS